MASRGDGLHADLEEPDYGADLPMMGVLVTLTIGIGPRYPVGPALIR